MTKRNNGAAKVAPKPRSGPTQSDTDRRAKGLVLVRAWLPAATVDKLDDFCEQSGLSRTEQLDSIIRLVL